MGQHGPSTDAERSQSALDYGCVDDRLAEGRWRPRKGKAHNNYRRLVSIRKKQVASEKRAREKASGDKRQKVRAERCAYDGKREYQRIYRKGRSTMGGCANKPRVGCVRKWKCL